MKTNLIRKPTDYVKGVNSQIEWVEVLPSGDWRPYVSDSLEQMLKFDTDGCSQASPMKTSMEGQLNWMLKNNLFSPEALTFFNSNGYIQNGLFYISYQFNACLDGTSINGNNPSATAQSYRTDGIIPRSMLNMTLAQSQQYNSQAEQDAAFYDSANITSAMRDLGQQSLKYILTQYQWINEDDGTSTPLSVLAEAQKQAPLVYGIPIPSPVSNYNQTLVKYDGGRIICHCVGGLYTDPTNAFPIYIEDNYVPFVKQLSADYYIGQVLQIFVSLVPPPDTPTISYPLVQKLISLLNWLHITN